MGVLTEYRAQIFGAFWTTIQLTVYSAVGARVLGIVLAAMRLAPVPMLTWMGTAYVNVIRNTPADIDHPVLLVRIVAGAGDHAG